VVIGRQEVTDELSGKGQPLAADRAVVLDGDRHAGKRARIVGGDLVGLGQRLVGEDVDERVERGVELRDAIQRGLHELARGELARAHERGELVDGAKEEIGAGGGGHEATITACAGRHAQVVPKA
jgi:hypothetical protein